MAHFQYLAIDADGQRRNGALEAANEAAARALLVRRNLLPVQIDAGQADVRRPAEAARAPSPGAKLNHKTLLL